MTGPQNERKQAMAALEKGNTLRIERAKVLRSLRLGEITVSEALGNEYLAGVRFEKIARSLPMTDRGRGDAYASNRGRTYIPKAVLWAMDKARIGFNTTAQMVTPTQKRVLLKELDQWLHQPARRGKH